MLISSFLSATNVVSYLTLKIYFTDAFPVAKLGSPPLLRNQTHHENGRHGVEDDLGINGAKPVSQVVMQEDGTKWWVHTRTMVISTHSVSRESLE